MESVHRKSWMLFNEVYFYTATILDWKKLLTQDKYKQIIIDSLKNLCERKKIVVYAFVIMPNHIHLIWEMLAKNGKENPSASLLKFTAHQFEADLREKHPQVLPFFQVEKSDRKYQFWQIDSFAVKMLSREVCEQKIQYIHNNPLQEKWNLATTPEEYLWSSANFYETLVDDFGFLTHYRDRF